MALFCAAPPRLHAQAPGLALVIGIDGPVVAAQDRCNHVAATLRDALQRQGYAVETLIQPTAVVLRQAIGDLAVQLAGSAAPRSLIYVCARATASGGRLFVLPADAADHETQPQTTGVVIPAFLNALSGTGGSLYTDLVLEGAVEHGASLAALLPQVPQGLHAMLSVNRRPVVGTVLSDAAIGADWGRVASTVAHEAGVQDGSVLMTQTPEAAAAPDPAATALVMTDAAPAGVRELADDSAGMGRLERSRPAGEAKDDVGEDGRNDAKARGRERVASTHVVNHRLMRLQDALARLGYYRGQPSGTQDDATKTAIIAFQQHLGDAPTGTMSSTEVIRLLNAS